MKQIGFIDGASAATAWKTHALGMLSQHDLFIPNPGERENVSADQWIHVGWVDPDKDGGQIWTSHAEAGDNSRPAYVQREALTGMIVADGPIRFERLPKYGGTGCKPASDSDNMTAIVQLNKRLDDLEAGTQPLMPGEEQQNDMSDAIEKLGLKRSMGVLFARLELHSTRLEKLEEICRPDLVARGVLSPGAAAKLTMSKEYGKLPSTIPTSELLSEALALCNDRLDEHRGSISCENAYADCNAANTMIRELVRRFPAEPAPSVAAERPMTFYDHAFIHAAVNHADYYSGSTMTQAVIDDAHAVASMLTRNRANRT